MRVLRLSRVLALGFMCYALSAGIKHWQDNQWPYVMIFVIAGLGFITAQSAVEVIITLRKWKVELPKPVIAVESYGGGGGGSSTGVTVGYGGRGGSAFVSGSGTAVAGAGGAGYDDGSGSDLPVSTLRYGRDMTREGPRSRT